MKFEGIKFNIMFTISDIVIFLPYESLITAILGQFLHKFGKLDYTIHAHWKNIVGSFFVEHSEPIKITSISNIKNIYDEDHIEKYLHVNVTPSAAIEFQHFQKKIVEKINSYFGYKAIAGIKIHQKLVKKQVTNLRKNYIDPLNHDREIKEVKNMTQKVLLLKTGALL